MGPYSTLTPVKIEPPWYDDTVKGYWLELATVRRRETIFAQAFDHPDMEEFSSHLSLATYPVSIDNSSSDYLPVSCYQCTLCWLPDEQSFQLITDILWQDTILAPGRLQQTQAALALFQYAPHGEAEYEMKRPPLGNYNRRRIPGVTWSPRAFYDNVHVPTNTPETSADLKCDLAQCELYPFQNRAVRWLLEKEGMESLSDGRVVPRPQKRAELPDSFQEFVDADGRRCFASQLYKVVTTDLSGWNDAGKSLKGGILAEEMGLGKSVEMILLICLHQRTMIKNESGKDAHSDSLIKSRATLIITPPAILEQWKQELLNHAPALSVFDYTGFQRQKNMTDEDLIRMLAEHDVVLTTYNVLSREVHHAVDAPVRSLRAEKRFEIQKTPLVRIHWWRVCLDEAQMIESGVTNAARVARLIPRVNAWAVTGTPIRKDMDDLFGLLQFLNYEPVCSSPDIWTKLYEEYPAAFKSIVNKLALRHSKDMIREDLRLPLQKRVVITIPFTAVEEQHYSHLFEHMCEECGVDSTGSPNQDEWDPESSTVVERMRSWLTRLRQTCLHPEVAGSNRRALGTRNGPLRSVAEVLEVMIDQNDTLIRAEERALLLSQARRGQLLENAARRREALEIWQSALQRSTEIVDMSREQLRVEREKIQSSHVSSDIDTSDFGSEKEDSEESDKNSRLTLCRVRLRAALEVQHICKFFTANAFYQIKTDTNLTAPDSDEFKALEKAEEEAYEAAKKLRQEMLTDISQKVRRYMGIIDEQAKHNSYVKIPDMNPKLSTLGIESRRVFAKLEDFCEALNTHARQFREWRDKMVKLLRQSLIDEEGTAELEGNEYETSTKDQDEMYVYMEALRVMFADRHDALTGQRNDLINHEVKMGLIQAGKEEGPSPELYISIMKTRNRLKPIHEVGTLRGIISELRSLATSLEWQESGGSSRARAELVIVNEVLARASKMSNEQAKAVSSLEKEVELFRDTMNLRLEYYRQLQQISDTVAPYDEESVGKPLDEALFASKVQNEEAIDRKLSALRSKRRYLIHLRDDSGPDDSSRICVICQSTFEIGSSSKMKWLNFETNSLF
jgi:E3 ubiquitin-protein ligase SHPRH